MIYGNKLARSRALTLSAVATMAFALYAPTSLSYAVAAPQAAKPAQAPSSAAPFADSAFENVWMRTDAAGASHAADRSWTWGPSALSEGMEPYADAPDGSGQRLVEYFDKARMEINDSKADPTGKWFVTNGLLTVELISGRVQLGNSKFEDRKPADIPIASDGDDTNAPTYASFGRVSNTSAGAQPQPDSTGKYATGRINKAGQVTQDTSKNNLALAKIVYYEKSTGHNVPKVFWDFLNSSTLVRSGRTNATKPFLDPWVFAMGLPISDAYWATVKIEGKQQEVLIEAFERRVLTYAPGLPQGWQVQMGNIGQHYLQWRYNGNAGPQKQPATTPSLPAWLTIPSLGVQVSVEHVGVDKSNNMDIPTNPNNVAWFKLGTVPGNVGNAAIDGHLNWYGIPQGIFYYVNTLKQGDRIYVRDDRGRDRTFIVTKQQICDYQNCPLQDIFGPTNGVHLNSDNLRRHLQPRPGPVRQTPRGL